jgi:hypothetical protein
MTDAIVAHSNKKFVSLLLLLALLSVPSYGRKKDDKTLVDSGSFGVFVNGTRVATETFRIEQQGGVSVATSEFKAEDSSSKIHQKAELQILPNGDLQRYTWHELSPGKAEEVVEPVEQFLIEHITPNSHEKPSDQPFLLPPSTMVLDDYFFSQREILTWRYLAQSCGGTITPSCAPEKAQFGVIVPRQHISATVTMEYAGKEKTLIRNQEQELHRFNLISDGQQWAMYLNDQFKIVRILIASENTEVVRD